MKSESGQVSNHPQFLIRHASLRQIQIFEAVARHLSFTKAAQELFLTQPTVSVQVKSFSESIGIPLYEQIGRNIFLTEVGKHVASSCRDIINQLSNLEILLDDFRGMTRGCLKVALVSTAKYFVPIALGQFIKKHPDISLSLKIVNRENLLKRIHQNLDDLYILGQIPTTHLDLEVIPFASNPLVVIANRENELAGQKVTLKKLAKQPFLMREEGSGTRSTVEKIFAKKGLKINERMTLDTNEAINHCVIGGLGVAVVSKHTLHFIGSNSPIIELDVEEFPVNRQWNIVYHKGKELSLLTQEFLTFLQDKSNEYIKLD
ncbi:LysR substrate-binding domain-containing protein [Candidatus Thioglobus sp.]|uniref:LysR family transcriptional regulator n=1 Tax=Candidatus Thioglobus sp. TaxID=2026721 RepID=UPI003D0A8D27